MEQGLSRAGPSTAAAKRCPRLLDQQTVAKPRVPCRLLITYFLIFNQKVHVFYCSWYDFAAHLSRPRGSGDAPCCPVSHRHQSSCSASCTDWRPGQGFNTQGLYCFIFYYFDCIQNFDWRFRNLDVGQDTPNTLSSSTWSSRGSSLCWSGQFQKKMAVVLHWNNDKKESKSQNKDF